MIIECISFPLKVHGHFPILKTLAIAWSLSEIKNRCVKSNSTKSDIQYLPLRMQEEVLASSLSPIMLLSQSIHRSCLADQNHCLEHFSQLDVNLSHDVPILQRDGKISSVNVR